MSRILLILSPAYPQLLVGSWLRLDEMQSLGGLVIFPVAVTEESDKCQLKREKMQSSRMQTLVVGMSSNGSAM